jgi:O-succinylbenzoic acid--CoA ligase
MPKAEHLLRLNFSSFDKAWMQNYAYTLLRDGWSLTPWKKEVLYFMIDWLSHDEEIKSTTSGSTGAPKTISLKKEHVKNSAKATVEFFGLKEGDKALLCLPVRYIAGKLMLVRALENKMNLYCVEPSLTPDFSETEIDFAAMTPAQVSALLQTEKGRQMLNNIRKLIIGGDKIPAVLEEQIQELNTAVWHTYGMTETITHIAVRKVNGSNRSGLFTPLPGVTVSLAGDSTLVIDAPHLGVRFLKTNDVAELREDGTFRIKGRKDHVVISGGIKLFPGEIEKKVEKLIDLPFFFTGLPDDQLGSRLVLVIESSRPVDEKALLNKIKPVLGKYELPKQILVKERFERTGSDKIKRVV